MTNLREELGRICDDNGGDLTPAAVVAAAEPNDSPLHSRFEWDDAIAGPLYREHQASEMIRSLRVGYGNAKESKTVREYLSVYETGGQSGVYRRAEVVLADPLSAAMLLRNLEREVAELKRRYGHLKEFADILRGSAA